MLVRLTGGLLFRKEHCWKKRVMGGGCFTSIWKELVLAGSGAVTTKTNRKKSSHASRHGKRKVQVMK